MTHSARSTLRAWWPILLGVVLLLAFAACSGGCIAMERVDGKTGDRTVYLSLLSDTDVEIDRMEEHAPGADLERHTIKATVQNKEGFISKLLGLVRKVL